MAEVLGDPGTFFFQHHACSLWANREFRPQGLKEPSIILGLYPWPKSWMARMACLCKRLISNNMQAHCSATVWSTKGASDVLSGVSKSFYRQYIFPTKKLLTMDWNKFPVHNPFDDPSFFNEATKREKQITRDSVKWLEHCSCSLPNIQTLMCRK